MSIQPRRRAGIIALAGAGLLLAAAGLNVAPISTLFFWRISVVTSEWGGWLALPALLLAGAGLRGRGGMRYAGAAALIAAVLFLRPVWQAERVAQRLPGRLEQAVGPLPAEERGTLPPPFSLKPLYGGSAPRPAPLRLAYAGPLHLDFYRARREGPAPCVVVIHGGGWNTGTPAEISRFDGLLARQGYAVAAIEYRLAPAATWPAPREDVGDALRYLKEHAAELGVDPRRFVLLGRSAGGQIAEAAAYAAGDPAIRGCIAFYAPADLYLAFRYAHPGDILDSYDLLLHYMGGTPRALPERYTSASAILQVREGRTPPTLLFHGSRDPLVWPLQSRRLAARLREAHVPSALVELPWATHAFDYDGRTPGGQLAAYAVLYFLAVVTQ